MSKRALAAAMGYTPSYLSHMESGRHKPSEDFARRDPYVANGLVTKWTVRPWAVVIGGDLNGETSGGSGPSST